MTGSQSPAPDAFGTGFMAYLRPPKSLQWRLHIAPSAKDRAFMSGKQYERRA
jgi:hypothetical protein